MVSFDSISTRKNSPVTFLVGSQSWGKLFSHPTTFGKGRKIHDSKKHQRTTASKVLKFIPLFQKLEDFFSKRAGPFSRNENIKTPTICPIVKGKSFQQIPIPFNIKFVSPPGAPLKNCLWPKTGKQKFKGVPPKPSGLFFFELRRVLTLFLGFSTKKYQETSKTLGESLPKPWKHQDFCWDGNFWGKIVDGETKTNPNPPWN